MAITINCYQAFDVLLDSGVVHKGGSLVTARTISCDSEIVFDRTYSISATTVTEIWSDTNLADFDFLFIVSDTAGTIQIVTGENQAGEAHNYIPLAANIPFMLAGGDASKRDTSIDTWESTGSADDIDRIEWYHSSGTAIVRVFAAT